MRAARSPGGMNAASALDVNPPAKTGNAHMDPVNTPASNRPSFGLATRSCGPASQQAKRGPRGTVVAVALGFVVATAQALEPPPTELWIAAEAPVYGDGSSAEQPLDGSSATRLERVLDELYARHGDFGPGLRLRFLPGAYETGGIALRPNWWIEGAGMEQTVLRRVATERDRRFRASYYRLISGGWEPQQDADGARLEARDYRNLRVADLTLDANWTGLKEALGPPVKKASGLALLCREAEIARVKVVHYGAYGGRPSWQEVFPIMVVSMPTDPAGGKGYESSVIEIHDCVVEGPVEGPRRAVASGYATGILVGHRDANPATHRVDVRVHHNEVRDLTNGMAFGGAYVRSAVFEHNRAVRCNGGFNFDTGGNQDVTIRHNEFLDCVSGGNIVFGARFLIESNLFRIPYDVPGEAAAWNHALRIRDLTRSFEIRNNRLEVPPETVPNPLARTLGIYVYGTGIGFEWQREGDAWRLLMRRHVIADNSIDPVLVNRAVPTKPGDWMYLQIDGRDLNLSGEDGVGDGASYEW